MSRTKLSEKFTQFIQDQKMFFVATAGVDGRVNTSPKGMDSLRIMSDKRIVWLNLSGSGSETAAHVQELNRMTLMFCAFEGQALIVRVYGRAKVIYPRDVEWSEFVEMFPKMAGSRQIFDLEIDAVHASCGTGVPFYDFKGQRGESEMVPFYAEMGEDGVQKYWKKKNEFSIDGKPTHIFA
ncbi:MAG: pyridoxamine 5'-phosphate oxidase family protein [Anaerolineae bacterium]